MRMVRGLVNQAGGRVILPESQIGAVVEIYVTTASDGEEAAE